MTQSNNRQPKHPFEDAEIISSYSRKQAIEDGVLIDLTPWAKETGFVMPVACTTKVWSQHIEPPVEVKSCGQDVRGRAHDLLWMLYLSIRHADNGADRLTFKVRFLLAPSRYHLVKFKSVCGPGDQAEPVITIMMPDED